MMKTAAILGIAMICVSTCLAGSKAGDGCCAKKASHSETMACIDYASLQLTADQKSKIETWQAQCTKAGCTKESRQAFLKNAKRILSADQYAKLKEQCDSKMTGKAKA